MEILLEGSSIVGIAILPIFLGTAWHKNALFLRALILTKLDKSFHSEQGPVLRFNWVQKVWARNGNGGGKEWQEGMAEEWQQGMATRHGSRRDGRQNSNPVQKRISQKDCCQLRTPHGATHVSLLHHKTFHHLHCDVINDITEERYKAVVFVLAVRLSS